MATPTALSKLFTYLVGAVVLLFACVFATVATAFAGTIHGAPFWYAPYLALTQALPILLFAISSCHLLISIANNTRFQRMRHVWVGAVVTYSCSFLALMGLGALGFFP